MPKLECRICKKQKYSVNEISNYVCDICFLKELELENNFFGKE